MFSTARCGCHEGLLNGSVEVLVGKHERKPAVLQGGSKGAIGRKLDGLSGFSSSEVFPISLIPASFQVLGAVDLIQTCNTGRDCGGQGPRASERV